MSTPARLVIVGSGVAGLYAALLASDALRDGAPAAEVVLLSKGTLEASNTFYAQGGISAVLASGEAAPGDSVAAHIADTLAAGAGLNDPDAVRILCTEAVRDIAGLRRFGVQFDTGPGGGPALGLEAAHSAPRILHAGGDATGAGITRGLVAAVLERAVQGRLRVETGAFVTGLLTDPVDALTGGVPGQAPARTTGVTYLSNGVPKQLAADAVLLATGGAGRLFARTSNPAVATADGLALAWRAGAAVRDLEFFQFHPTTLAAGEIPGGPPPLLISEAVRGEGALLIDAAGYRFMPDYHPDAELAPRDVVSRSIALHLAATGAPAGSPVYLDARGVEAAQGTGFLARRFPTITAATRAAGYDWTAEPLPVSPAAHYWMGGICTDAWARTSVPGLYAAGEVACTGAQGANRLASNSLLEGLVFGRRAVEAFLGDPASAAFQAAGPRSGVPAAGPVAPPAGAGYGLREGLAAGAGEDSVPARDAVPFSRQALGRLMTGAAGVARTGADLDAAAAQLDRWAAQLDRQAAGKEEGAGTLHGPAAPPPDQPLDQAGHEDRNLLLAARLLVAAARKREISVGAHYRADSTPRKATTAGAAQAAPTPEGTRPVLTPRKFPDRQAAGTRPMQRI